jgi:hypothetical protein
MRTTGLFAAVAASALALTLAGCSGGGGDAPSQENSPLSQYLSPAYGGDLSPEEQQKQFEEQQRKIEELMAECMAKEGFEYEPNLQSSGLVFADDDTEWEPEKKEWVEKYGYGIVVNPYAEQGEEQPAEEYVDPNQEYLDSLSESERTAFYETAYGAPVDEDATGEDGSYEYRWEDGGCQGWAQHELQGDDPWQSDEFAELRDKMNTLWSTAQDSPEFVELNGKWAACMADAGEPGFTRQEEAAQSISEAQNAIYESAASDGGEIDPEKMEDPNTSPEMKELGEREIALALVDLSCREKTDYRAEAMDIQFAIEEKFIRDNKAELEAFKAAAEQNS